MPCSFVSQAGPLVKRRALVAFATGTKQISKFCELSPQGDLHQNSFCLGYLHQHSKFYFKHGRLSSMAKLRAVAGCDESIVSCAVAISRSERFVTVASFAIFFASLVPSGLGSWRIGLDNQFQFSGNFALFRHDASYWAVCSDGAKMYAEKKFQEYPKVKKWEYF
jgi:hypothetical protein